MGTAVHIGCNKILIQINDHQSLFLYTGMFDKLRVDCSENLTKWIFLVSFLCAAVSIFTT